MPTAYGRAASQALRDAVARAKHDDALAPVTVVVPTNSVGVSARRRLASGELGSVSDGRPRRRRRDVPHRVPARGAARRGRRSRPRAGGRCRLPWSRRRCGARWRARPGLFAPVARASRDRGGARRRAPRARRPRRRPARRARPRSIPARAKSSGCTARRSRCSQREWYDEHDLMQAATESPRRGRPARTRARHGHLLPAAALEHARGRAAARAGRAAPRLEIIVGLTGSAAGRRAGRSRACGASARSWRPGPRSASSPSRGTEVWNASDPDDEVRTIVRGVVDAMRAGVPLERMAVLYASDEPYARLAARALRVSPTSRTTARRRGRCRTPCSGAGCCSCSRSPTPTSPATTCAACSRPRRCSTDAADRSPRRGGSGSRARRASCAASTSGATRLDGVRGVVRRRRVGAIDERAQVEALGAFVAGLAADLDPGPVADARGAGSRSSRTGSSGASSAPRRAAVRGRRSNRSRRGASKPCSTGWARSTRSIPARRSRVFRRTFELELDAARDRVGRLGDGVLVGPVGMALGVDLDRVWVCGLAEGLFPSVPTRRSAARRPRTGCARGRAAAAFRSHGRRRTRAARGARLDRGRARVHLSARRSAAQHRTRSVAVPRGDDRGGRRRGPVDPVVRVRGDARRVPREPPRARGARRGGGRTVGGVRRPRSRAGSSSRRRARRARSPASTATSRTSPTVCGGISPAHPERVTSPTRLQTWAACPHAYFMEHGAARRAGRAAGRHHAARARSIAARSCTRCSTGSSARPATAPTPVVRGPTPTVSGLRAIADGGVRARRGPRADRPAAAVAPRPARDPRSSSTRSSTPTRRSGPVGSRRRSRPSSPFGMLGSRRRSRSRCRWATGGSCACGARPIGSIGEPTATSSSSTTRPDRSAWLQVARRMTTPVTAGTHLQLPVYAYAARAAYGKPDTTVEAYYWFVGQGQQPHASATSSTARSTTCSRPRCGRSSTASKQECSRPGPPEPAPTPFVECHYCDPDGMGTADRWREWERKFDAPELVRFHRLAPRRRTRRPGEVGIG